MQKSSKWEWEIQPHQKWYNLDLEELYRYRGLVRRFVKRDLLSNYHQTIMGSLWLILQPLLTTVVFVIIFGNIMRIPTGDFPPLLFYLTGNILWSFFSDCLTGAMFSFRSNAHIFKKIYFPRLIIPLSSVATHALRLSIQLLLLLFIFAFYAFGESPVTLTASFLLLPFIFILTACFAIGSGLLISTFSVKYRDLETLMQYILRLYMFASPIVYPSSIVEEKYRFIYWLNPLTPLVETFRSAFSKTVVVDYSALAVSIVIVMFVFITGVVVFKYRELKVMDYL